MERAYMSGSKVRAPVPEARRERAIDLAVDLAPALLWNVRVCEPAVPARLTRVLGKVVARDGVLREEPLH